MFADILSVNWTNRFSQFFPEIFHEVGTQLINNVA